MVQAQLYAIGNGHLVQDNLFIEGKASSRMTLQHEEYRLQIVIESGHQGIGDMDVLAGVQLEVVLKKNASPLRQ